ncbi:phosphoglycerol transferase MdoB-like AlkP superfamily enzyme [Arthrobacter pigmenti]|uniref:Phosphoglycerol transferase MdoB-like AlkP superfamily enzyme n=1 Tax=Arthrobacter pigmenti TaxID=271432 RepID=A0A846RV38_9MICC|nr:hypothetical protein [Arthrobacter pigmenti]NJC22886.1 phosphoglycerol transferase MdoB-like AlkP superfamily enzyme [Arthrobacter pigmenti]
MSDVFWEAQDSDETEEESELKYKRPWWITVGAIVDLLLLFAIVPAGILSLIPFMFLIYVYLAQVIIWVSPVLVLMNIAVFWWSFRRKQAATTALAALGLAFVAVSFVVLMLWQAQIVILGFNF